MPLDYEDVETDHAYGEKKVFEGESSVDLDYKSSIELVNIISKLSMKKDKMHEKAQEDLESLMSQVSLNEEEDSRDSENEEEIISRAPIGGVPIMPENFFGINLNSNHNIFSGGSKPKRSFDDREIHAIKYTKPTEHSVLQLQCSTLSDFSNQNIKNSHQTSGGIMTINPTPSMASSEEYDSSFSPGESSYGSPPEDVQVVSPVSDYSSMASPDCNDFSLIDPNCDSFGIDETQLKDILEIIKKEQLKEKLEKALCEDNLPPQHVPQQGSLPSSSPPSLYNPELNQILGDLMSSGAALSQQNQTPNQQQFFSQQPPVTAYNTQPQHPVLVNSNHLQFTHQQQNQQHQQQNQQHQQQQHQQQQHQQQQHHQQQHHQQQQQQHQQQQQQPQIVTTSSPLHYSLQSQQPNIKYEPITQQHYPSAPQIISTTGNQPQYVVQQPQIYTQSQQPVLSPSLYGYNNQQNQLSITPTVSNQHFTPQRQTQVMPNSSKQFPVAFHSISPNQHFPQTCAVQQQSQMINSTSNQQHFPLPQHQTTVYNSIHSATSKQQYTTPSPQQHVTTSQGHVTGCAIQATQPAIQQLSPVLQQLPSDPVVTPKNPGLPLTNAPDQDGVSTSATSSNKAVIIVAQPNSPNSIMLLPTTNSQVIYIPHNPVVTKNKAIKPRVILPKPPNSDSNGNQVDLKKLSSQARKGRSEKDKSSQQSENIGQGNLCVARRCVAGMKEEDLENMDRDGDNYLHVAVCKTDVYMIEALLERLKRSGKLNMIDKQNNARQTPLYLAVSANQPAMVHKLVRYGANVNLKGMTRGYKTERAERAPIHCAASQGKDYCDTLKELFKSENIDPDILNSDGLSALHCAISEHGKLVPNQKSYVTKIDNCQNVYLLLKHKANPNLQDRCSGKTPLMYAIENKDYAMVDAILKGVDSSKIPQLLTTKTFDGRTCMKIADGLRNEFDPHTWQKLHNFLSSVN